MWLTWAIITLLAHQAQPNPAGIEILNHPGPGMFFENLGNYQFTEKWWRLTIKVNLDFDFGRLEESRKGWEALIKKAWTNTPAARELVDYVDEVVAKLKIRIEETRRELLKLKINFKKEEFADIESFKGTDDKYPKNMLVRKGGPSIMCSSSLNLDNEKFEKYTVRLVKMINQTIKSSGELIFSFNSFGNEINYLKSDVRMLYTMIDYSLRAILEGAQRLKENEIATYWLNEGTLSNIWDQAERIIQPLRVAINRDVFGSRETSKIMKFFYGYFENNLFLHFRMPLVKDEKVSAYHLQPLPVVQTPSLATTLAIKPKGDLLLIKKGEYHLLWEKDLNDCHPINNVTVCGEVMHSFVPDDDSCELKMLLKPTSASLSNCRIEVKRGARNVFKESEEISTLVV